MHDSGILRLAALMAAVTGGCSGGPEAGMPAPAGAGVRPAAVAGMFYERQPFALDSQVERLLRQAAKVDVKGTLVAGVVPHAGYVFSGKCAASLYALVRTGQYERVIILAPSHHGYFEGIALPAAELSDYATPLGLVPIDREACEALAKQQGFARRSGPDAREHAIEVQLPFLQKTAGQFRLVPLLCGRITETQVESLAGALVPYLGTTTLVLASSDFTHFGPNYGFEPFRKDVPQQLKAWLARASGTIASRDPAGFRRHCRETQDTICGALPIQLLLSTLAQSALRVQGRVLDRATSGDVVGDYQNSVSYAAIGFFVEPAAAAEAQPKEATVMKSEVPGAKSGDFSLKPENQQRLLEIARQSITAHLSGQPPPRVAVDDPELTTPAAVFVTLTQRGQLRGCIGTTEPRAPLHQAVAELAVEAAVRDPRFPPLTRAELPGTHIEISVLSPLRRVKNADEIRPRVHGVVVRRGFHSGLFLPQVWEHFAKKEDFLNELCRQKAHLEPGAWKDPATELYVFTVLAFEEAKH